MPDTPTRQESEVTALLEELDNLLSAMQHPPVDKAKIEKMKNLIANYKVDKALAEKIAAALIKDESARQQKKDNPK